MCICWCVTEINYKMDFAKIKMNYVVFVQILIYSFIAETWIYI